MQIEQDIHKLADWIEKVTREGVAIERKILEWKLQERAAEAKAKSEAAKAS